MATSIDEEILRRGYRQYPSIVVPSSEAISLIRTLNQGTVAKENYFVKKMKMEEAFKDSTIFLDSIFRLHDIPRIESTQIGTERLKKVEYVKPYDLPLFPVDTDYIFHGEVIENIPVGPATIVYFLRINLCSTVTEQTSVSLVHELTHTQLDSVKGSIGEYYNAEVLSIVMGNIIASMLDKDEHLLRINDACRIYEMMMLGNNLVNYHDGLLHSARDEQLADSQYFISDIKAYKIFLDYYYGDIRIKKEILKDIQRVFDGIMTVEEMLNKYEATADIKNNEKRLVKYFNR